MYLEINKFSKNIISQKTLIKSAISKINELNYKILFIIDGNKKYLGTVTDGDIRRASLNNISINQPILKITNLKSLAFNEKFGVDKIYEIMNFNGHEFCAILNKKKNIKKIFAIKELDATKKKLTAVIMAGGLGKRLLPLTKEVPKPMIEIDGKPMLQKIIEKLRNEGIINIIISVNYLSNIIIKYFGKGEKFGVKIVYKRENKRLGTAGALKLIKKNDLYENDFIVLNGDVLSEINFSNFIKYHKSNNAIATMAISRYPHQVSFGVVESKDNIFIGLKEKPYYQFDINAGIYAFNSKIIRLINRNKFLDMNSLFNKINKKYKNKVFTYPLHENWNDLGTHKILNKFK